LQADGYAESLRDSDRKKYWEKVHMDSGVETAKFAETVNGTVEHVAVAVLWKSQSEDLYIQSTVVLTSIHLINVFHQMFSFSAKT
jgi:hypothetical protein